jgi:hypothetical protein
MALVIIVRALMDDIDQPVFFKESMGLLMPRLILNN